MAYVLHCEMTIVVTSLVGSLLLISGMDPVLHAILPRLHVTVTDGFGNEDPVLAIDDRATLNTDAGDVTLTGTSGIWLGGNVTTHDSAAAGNVLLTGPDDTYALDVPIAWYLCDPLCSYTPCEPQAAPAEAWAGVIGNNGY